MPPTAARLACPACGSAYSRVMHVQYHDDDSTAVGIWRRRQCLSCHARYTTMGTERVVGTPTITIALEIIPPRST